jgi:hypothetical protein
MENRDRDKMSRNTGSTEAGDVNRQTSSRQGQKNSDSSASFGQNIGRSENWDREPSRRRGSSDESSESSRRSSSGEGYESSSSRDSSSEGYGSPSRNSSSGRGSSGSMNEH